MGLSMEQFKEHLMILCMNKKVVEDFDKIEPTTKAAFTRAFNKEKDDLKGKKVKKGGKGGAGKNADTSTIAGDEGEEKIEGDTEEEEDMGDALIAEEDLLEIKKGK